MSRYTVEAWCPCGAEIEGLTEFAHEPVCCMACRRVLSVWHECDPGGCYQSVEVVEGLWLDARVWQELLAGRVLTGGAQPLAGVDYSLIAAQLEALRP